MKLPDAILTDLLTIRPFHQDDLDRYLSFMTDERVTRHLMFTDEQKTGEGAKHLFTTIMRSYVSENPIFAYAIALKDNSFIGSCGVSVISVGDVLECYYSLLPNYWKNGFATEATEALIQYCFRHYPIHEIRAYMSPGNPNSSGVAERVGMAYQGIQKHPVFGNEGKVYSITREMVQASEVPR
jgi:RimJ/RimL family protein N-acetyltransferase